MTQQKNGYLGCSNTNITIILNIIVSIGVGYWRDLNGFATRWSYWFCYVWWMLCLHCLTLSKKHCLHRSQCYVLQTFSSCNLVLTGFKHVSCATRVPGQKTQGARQKSRKKGWVEKKHGMVNHSKMCCIFTSYEQVDVGHWDFHFRCKLLALRTANCQLTKPMKSN